MAHQETRSVTFTFRSSSLESAVYIVGSFTNPPWEVRQQLFETVTEEGEDNIKTFTSVPFELPTGNWLYKFVTESGEWLCDESAEMVIDEKGNCNNILRIEHQHSRSSIHQDKPTHVRQHNNDGAAIEHPVWNVVDVPDKVDLTWGREHLGSAPLLSHESQSPLFSPPLFPDFFGTGIRYDTIREPSRIPISIPYTNSDNAQEFSAISQVPPPSEASDIEILGIPYSSISSSSQKITAASTQSLHRRNHIPTRSQHTERLSSTPEKVTRDPEDTRWVDLLGRAWQAVLHWFQALFARLF